MNINAILMCLMCYIPVGGHKFQVNVPINMTLILDANFKCTFNNLEPLPSNWSWAILDIHDLSSQYWQFGFFLSAFFF